MIVVTPKSYNPWFDLFRGLAAFLVCIGHVRNAFWVDYGEIQLRAWWHAPAYLITGFGHQAVIVFFVLSGFLVGGSVLVKKESFFWIDYFSSRLVRLWVVLIPALIFTAACDYLTIRIQPDAFNGELSSLWNSGPSTLEGFGVLAFTGNILFLQTILVPVFGSNGPLWSLANEFWYYCIFPLFVFGLNGAKNSSSISRLSKLLLAFAICAWLPRDIFLYFAVWLMGVAAFALTRKYSRKYHSLLVLVCAVLLVFALIAAKAATKNENLLIWSDVLIGVLFSFLVVAMNGYKNHWIGRGLLGRCIKLTSDFSYSLYLFHFPLVVLLATILVGKAQLQPNMYSVLIILVVTTLIFISAWLAWFLFERHYVFVRNILMRFFQNNIILNIR